MKTYTIHRKPGAADTDTAGVVAIREGFTWLGFLFPLIWALFNRLWLLALIYLAVTMVFAVAAELLALDSMLSVVLGLMANLYMGLEGNNWRRAKLAALGYGEEGAYSGHTIDEAELAYFSARQNMSMPPRNGSSGNKPQAERVSTETTPGVGLFPAAG